MYLDKDLEAKLNPSVDDTDCHSFPLRKKKTSIE